MIEATQKYWKRVFPNGVGRPVEPAACQESFSPIDPSGFVSEARAHGIRNMPGVHPETGEVYDPIALANFLAGN